MSTESKYSKSSLSIVQSVSKRGCATNNQNFPIFVVSIFDWPDITFPKTLRHLVRISCNSYDLHISIFTAHIKTSTASGHNDKIQPNNQPCEDSLWI